MADIVPIVTNALVERGVSTANTERPLTPRFHRVDLTLLATIGSGRGFGFLEQVSSLNRRQVTDRLSRMTRTIGPVLELEAGTMRLTLGGGKLVWAATNFFQALDAATTRLYSRGEQSAARGIVSLRVPDLALGAVLDSARADCHAPLFEISHGAEDAAAYAVASGQVDAALVGAVLTGRRRGATGSESGAQGRDAMIARDVVFEPPVLSVPEGHRLLGPDATGTHPTGTSAVELAAIDDAVCALRLDAAGTARWCGAQGHPEALQCTQSTSVARHLALRDRRPLVSWPTAGLGHLPGWRTVPLATDLRRTLRLISDPLSTDEATCTSIVVQVQHGHRAQMNALGAALADSCEYPQAQAAATHPAAVRPLDAMREPRRPLDSDDYFLLDAIRQTGSINRAASRLASSQSVISRRVQQLESVLGCTVVHRSSTGAQLARPIEALLLDIDVHARRLTAVLNEIADRPALQADRSGAIA